MLLPDLLNYSCTFDRTTNHEKNHSANPLRQKTKQNHFIFNLFYFFKRTANSKLTVLNILFIMQEVYLVLITF